MTAFRESAADPYHQLGFGTLRHLLTLHQSSRQVNMVDVFS